MSTHTITPDGAYVIENGAEHARNGTSHEVNDGRGPCLLTYSGGYFYPLSAGPEEIKLIDIAHALSNQCRFGGAVEHFYSVAQHAVVCSWIAEERGHSQDLVFEALMHDASEAYLVDMPRPAKMLLPQYYDLEAKIMGVLGETYGFNSEMSSEVKAIDNVVLHMEARDFGLKFNMNWGNDSDPLPGFRIIPTSPAYARDLFIRRFCELTGWSYDDVLNQQV
jgi:uncharacterized protein